MRVIRNIRSFMAPSNRLVTVLDLLFNTGPDAICFMNGSAPGSAPPPRRDIPKRDTCALKL